MEIGKKKIIYNVMGFENVHVIVRSKVTAKTTTNHLIPVKHFFDLSFRCSKLSESLWNRFKTILLDQEMDLKKSHRKIFFHHGEK